MSFVDFDIFLSKTIIKETHNNRMRVFPLLSSQNSYGATFYITFERNTNKNK